MTDLQEEQHTICLDFIQQHIEDSIFNYALERTEDLYDEEQDQLVRAMIWSVGMSEYGVVITPLGFLKSIFQLAPEEEAEENGYVPGDLFTAVTNAILEVALMLYGKQEEPTQTDRKQKEGIDGKNA